VTGLAVSAEPLLFGPGPASPPDNGLGGRLVVRTPPRGGCGNAFMLIVFLIDLPAPFTPGPVRNLGRTVELPFGVPPGVPSGVEGRLDTEGARRPLFGKPEASDLRLAIVGTFPVLLRVFVVGRAGKAVFGGP